MSLQSTWGYVVCIWDTAHSGKREERYSEPPYLRYDPTQFSSYFIDQSKSYISSWILSGMYPPSIEERQQSPKFKPDVNGIGKGNPLLGIIYKR